MVGKGWRELGGGVGREGGRWVMEGGGREGWGSKGGGVRRKVGSLGREVRRQGDG